MDLYMLAVNKSAATHGRIRRSHSTVEGPVSYSTVPLAGSGAATPLAPSHPLADRPRSQTARTWWLPLSRRSYRTPVTPRVEGNHIVFHNLCCLACTHLNPQPKPMLLSFYTHCNPHPKPLLFRLCLL